MEVHRDRYMHHMWLDGSCKIYRPCNVHEVRRRQNGILRSRQGRQHSRFLGCADVMSWKSAIVAGILIPWKSAIVAGMLLGPVKAVISECQDKLGCPCELGLCLAAHTLRVTHAG